MLNSYRYMERLNTYCSRCKRTLIPRVGTIYGYWGCTTCGHVLNSQICNFILHHRDRDYDYIDFDERVIPLFKEKGF